MEQIIEGTGDVFADLGLFLSEEETLKLQIAAAIAVAIQRKKITQVQAAELIGTDQSKVSALLRGHVKGFSTNRLLRILVSLGQNVDIRISAAKKCAGQIRVMRAA